MNVEFGSRGFIRTVGPALALVLTGVILVIVGFFLLGRQTEHYDNTLGIIINVTEFSYEGSGPQYVVDYVYDVNGASHEGSFTDSGGNLAVGDSIRVYYDPERPFKNTTVKPGGSTAPILLSVGLLAAAYGVYKTVKAMAGLRRRYAMAALGSAPAPDLGALRFTSGVSEYYFRFDGNSMLPGYLIEDADRRVLFEGKRLKSAAVGARIFEFTDHTKDAVSIHRVGHAVRGSSEEGFPFGAAFDLDDVSIRSVLNSRGISITVDTRGGSPYPVYSVMREGVPFARVEGSSVYVHEEDEDEHRDALPYNKMYYRIWTDADDLYTLFITVFAMSEC